MRPISDALSDGDDHPRDRGQSEVLGMVVLIGVIVVAAFLTIAIGAMALQSVQDTTEWETTQDTAMQAHSVLSEAATTGDPQEIPMGGSAVDAEVVEGGTLTISMHDGANACSQRLTEDLGALRYEGGDGAMIYEGGAIWSETEGGLAIEQAPPISHGPNGTTVSVLSVSAATTTDSGQLVAEPNETERKHLSQEIETLLTACPAGDYTDLRINVKSPYHEAWAEHFEQSVATTSNVTITQPTEESVVATIEDATAPIAVDGLGIQSVEAPTALAPGDAFTVETAIANDAFENANATVELDVTGTNVSRNETLAVDAFDTGEAAFTIDAATINASFTPGTTYEYSITVRNGTGTAVSTTNGSVTFGTTAPMVSLATVEHELANGDDDLTVTATLENAGLENGTGSVSLNLTDPSVDAPPQTVGPVDVAGGGATAVAFDVNVSGLAAGYYEYAVTGPNGTVTDAFTIADRPDGGAVVGNLRITDVDASATTLAVGESFATTVSIENVANETASGDLTLDVVGGPATSTTVSLAPGDGETATLEIDGDALAALAPGQTHDYAITLDSGGETETLEGSVYIGEPGSDLGVQSVNATVTNGSATITATLDNAGLANGTDSATLSMTAPDGTAIDFESTPQQSVTTRWGSTGTVSFALDVSSLAGNHTFTVAYGDESASGTLELSSLDEGDDGVAISGGGEGTVTVLGTEISGEWPNSGSEWSKRWAPTSVSVLQETDGEEQVHEFENDEGDVEDERNLNSYDTQTDTYEYSWEQSAGESTTITLRSTYWNPAGGYQYVNQRTEEGVTWYDYQPSNGLGSIARRVDASTNQNPENVQVLTDGDQVPQVSGVLPDQRNASQILNQGASDRIDPETNELTLDPNEAVFLFEMTTTTEQVPGDMWEYALEHDDESDPDYNDVIALVEFESDGGGSVPVEMNTTEDGSGLVIGTPSVSDGGGGSATIGDVETTEGDGATDGAEPEAPDVGVGEPSPPDDVNVEVDVVQID
ncbi:hypothetical protein GCM10028857_25790 [Salinarchaeum chitinilyticum]